MTIYKRSIRKRDLRGLYAGTETEIENDNIADLAGKGRARWKRTLGALRDSLRTVHGTLREAANTLEEGIQLYRVGDVAWKGAHERTEAGAVTRTGGLFKTAKTYGPLAKQALQKMKEKRQKAGEKLYLRIARGHTKEALRKGKK